MAAHAKETRKFDASRQDIISGLKYALRRMLVVRVVWADNNAGVDYVHGINVWTWGDKVQVRISEGGEVTVNSRCRFPFQIFDWGKNQRNAQLVLDWIAEYLELHADGDKRGK